MWNDESAALYCTHQKKNEGKKAPTNSKTQQGKTVSRSFLKETMTSLKMQAAEIETGSVHSW